MKMSEVFNLPLSKIQGGVMPMIEECSGNVICVIDSVPAEAIIHSVNCHDKLVEALEYLLGAIRSDPAPDGHDYVCAAELQADAVLVKAKG